MTTHPLCHRAPLWAALACAFALLSPASRALAQGGPPPAKVVLDAARLELLEEYRQVTGEIRAVRRSLVAAEVEGRVAAVEIDEGAAVEDGAVLVRLDEIFAALDERAAKHGVAEQEALGRERAAELHDAERDQARAEDLFARALSSEADVDNARTAVARATARLAQAKALEASARAEHERAVERRARHAVRAPFAGRVSAVYVERGHWLRVGDPVCEVAATGEVEAWLSVPEELVGRLAPHAVRVQVRVPSTGETVEAPVSAVVPQAELPARTFPVVVRLGNDAGRLLPGMRVSAMVPTGVRGELLTVHKDALRRDDAGTYVFFDAGGRAAVARVEVRFAVGERAVVRAPQLQGGAGIVVEGNERLFPGQPLRPMPPVARASATAGDAAGEPDGAAR
jgi:RND family efflux transporter MFP subunit